MSKKASWFRNTVFFLLMFSGASLVANTWITRDHVTGTAPELPLEQRIHLRSPSIEDDNSHPTLIYFYASWCPVCKVDLPAVESVASHYPVIAIAMQSGDNRSVLDHRAEHNINLDIINDPDGTLASSFRVRGVPTAFVVKNGDILFSTQGFSGWIGYWSRMLLASLF
jgi:thiol-disulfide isomerase/thioredoxin